jgi:hypothetical protein
VSAVLERVLALLAGVRAVRSGYIACCPAHDDRSPSLAVSEGLDGRILLHCRAGCATDDVLAACGLDWTDLFPRQHGRDWAPDGAAVRQKRVRQGLEEWSREHGQQLRREYWDRQRIELYGRERLARDHDDDLGWWLHDVAYNWGRPLEDLEAMLDDIDLARTDDELAAAYMKWREVCNAT